MLKFRESFVSAYHNYFINQMLTPGFILGEPDDREDFWLVADCVVPEQKPPCLSGRFYNVGGGFILTIEKNEILENPGGCLLDTMADGFRLLYPSGEVLLAVHCEVFANGYLSRIQGKLHDSRGALRMEPSFESAKIFGKARWGLCAPVRFQERDSSI